MTLYDILEISPYASPEVIQTAYNTLLKKYESDPLNERMKNLTLAFYILSDPQKRKEYDDYLNNKSNKTGATTKQSTSSPKKSFIDKIKYHDLLLIIIVLIVILIAIYPKSSTKIPSTTTTHTTTVTTSTREYNPMPQPLSGAILSGVRVTNGSTLTITASFDDSCFIKLKDENLNDVMSFFVRAGETATVNVPSRNLFVYFACGKTWYGKELLFGDKTSYSKDKNLKDFRNYTYSYSLFPTEYGNFSETPINKNEF